MHTHWGSHVHSMPSHEHRDPPDPNWRQRLDRPLTCDELHVWEWDTNGCCITCHEDGGALLVPTKIADGRTVRLCDRARAALGVE
jgi:hypothetical protein